MLTNLPLQLVPTADIRPDPSQPRKSTCLEQYEQLKLSVAKHGIMHPLLVRRDTSTQQLILIAGENRWLCAQDLGIDHVPCRIVDGELSAAKILTLQLIENLIRQELNPLDAARSLKRLQELEQCTQEQLAGMTHLSKASICRSFKLLQLPAEIQSLIELGQLSVSVALELHACTDAVTQWELAQKYVAGGMIREDVTRLVKQANAARKPDRSLALMMPLAKGVWLKVPTTMPIKQCKRALAAHLKRLKEAERNGVDLETVAAKLRTELSAKS